MMMRKDSNYGVRNEESTTQVILPPADANANASAARAFECKHIHPALERRRQQGSLRTLTPYSRHDDDHDDDDDHCLKSASSSSSSSAVFSFIDFSSNDYLGLAQSAKQHDIVQQAYSQLSTTTKNHHRHQLGSTGSRLLTGDSQYAHALERRLARAHDHHHHNHQQQPAVALLCNSGYDANLAVLSSLTAHGAQLLLDELCHNSIQMGVRMGRQKSNSNSNSSNSSKHSAARRMRQFRHNDLQDLERLLQELTMEENATNHNNHNHNNSTFVQQPQSSSSSSSIVIVVESIYSMDGDAAPLQDIFHLASRYHACVVVDEAHGLGVYGQHGLGLLQELQLQQHPSLLCAIYTFGKAAGCHGAIVCGSETLIQFLYNFGRPIVYSTSLPVHSLVCISCAYDTMTGKEGTRLRQRVLSLVQHFRSLMQQRILLACTIVPGVSLVESQSPIQALIVPGNQRCVDFCQLLHVKSNRSIKLFPIRSPTVPKGQERVRVVLHAFNTPQQVEYLVTLIQSCLQEMGLLLLLLRRDDEEEEGDVSRQSRL
jgi:8-amino-7-oxononanoate synthase